MAYANVTHLAKNMTFFLHSSHRPYSNWLNKEQKIGSDLNPIRNLKNRRFRETYVKRGGSKRTQKKKKISRPPKRLKKSQIVTPSNLPKCQEREMIRVYTNSFHVSGNPGRHQCMQSAYVAGSACCSGVNILP